MFEIIDKINKLFPSKYSMETLKPSRLWSSWWLLTTLDFWPHLHTQSLFTQSQLHENCPSFSSFRALKCLCWIIIVSIFRQRTGASILDPVTRIVFCDIELMVDSPSTIRVAKAQLTRQPLQSRYLSVSIWSRWQEMSGFVNSVTQARRPDRLSHRFPHPHLAVCQLFCETQTLFHAQDAATDPKI